MSDKRLIELKDYFLAYPDTEYLPNMFSEVVQALEQLQQENKKLKADNVRLKQARKTLTAIAQDEEQFRIKIAKENGELHKECLNHIERKKLYKEVIEEVIREIYKLRHKIICGKCICEGTTNLDNLLQILDKAKENK